MGCIILRIGRKMCEASKFTYLDEKTADTADDFYPLNRKEQYSKSSISGLLVCLNSKKAQLRSQEIELDSIKQKMVELDLQVDKFTITNHFISNQAYEAQAKHAELLQLKSDFSRDLKEWKEETACRKRELQISDDEVKERKSYLASLHKKDQQLRASIKAKYEENKNVHSHNLTLDLNIENNSNEISKRNEERDTLSKTALTNETVAKSLKNKIFQKEKELGRAKLFSGDLENTIRNKELERAKLEKKKEKILWESKNYEDHNQQIEKVNLQFKTDLEKLVIHLESLKKNNKHLNSCIKEYSQTGRTAANKILQQANK